MKKDRRFFRSCIPVFSILLLAFCGLGSRRVAPGTPKIYPCSARCYFESDTVVVYPAPFAADSFKVQLPDSCDGFLTNVSASCKGWLRIDYFEPNNCGDGSVTLPHGYKNMWVRSGTLGVGAIYDGGWKFKLYQSPGDTTKVIGITPGGGAVFDCRRDWVKIEGEGFDGKPVQGWFPPQVQCVNLNTNCCPSSDEIMPYIYKASE